MREVIFKLLVFVMLPSAALGQLPAGDHQPDLLSFEELQQLSQLDPLEGPLAEKVLSILTSPFISNSEARSGERAILLQSPQLGPCIRVAQWNIERGINLDSIKLIFSDLDAFKATIDTQKYPSGSTRFENAIRQAEVLKESSILILNEVDLGVKRTDYRDVTAELAKVARMNYVYGVEFFEIDQPQLGIAGKDEGKEGDVNPVRYKGLHGSAILSKYPIVDARVVPLKRHCYDWYRKELKGASPLEAAKRGVTHKVFLEEVVRETRRGGRTVVMADLHVPELPEKRLTVVNIHLESRCKPDCREDQIKEILELIQPIENPVIMAGDLNTSGNDATPTSIKRELRKRYKDPHFWGAQLIKFFTPVGLAIDAVGLGLGFARVERDPTADNIPIFAPHTEGGLFDEIEDFRFADGRAFDFRGDKRRSVDRRSKKLANSNERAQVGFKPTFKFERSVKNTVGQFKLDWILVKPYISIPKSRDKSYRFAPHFGRTLDDVNGVGKERISDHHPITVDLPLTDPRLTWRHQEWVINRTTALPVQPQRSR